jgi:hypothetical protein
MTQGKPTAALTARLRTNGQGTRPDALMALYDDLRRLDKHSEDFDYVTRRKKGRRRSPGWIYER